jgi:hypothetical protein
MLESDPEVLRDSARWGNTLPIIDDSFLHPLEVHGVVDVTHVVDVCRIDCDGVPKHISRALAS